MSASTEYTQGSYCYCDLQLDTHGVSITIHGRLLVRPTQMMVELSGLEDHTTGNLLTDKQEMIISVGRTKQRISKSMFVDFQRTFRRFTINLIPSMKGWYDDSTVLHLVFDHSTCGFISSQSWYFHHNIWSQPNWLALAAGSIAHFSAHIGHVQASADVVTCIDSQGIMGSG